MPAAVCYISISRFGFGHNFDAAQDRRPDITRGRSGQTKGQIAVDRDSLEFLDQSLEASAGFAHDVEALQGPFPLDAHAEDTLACLERFRFHEIKLDDHLAGIGFLAKADRYLIEPFEAGAG